MAKNRISSFICSNDNKTYTPIQLSRAGQQRLTKTLTGQLCDKGVQHDNNTIYNYSKLHTRKLEKSTFTMLILKVHNTDKFTVGGNTFQTLITQSTKKLA